MNGSYPYEIFLIMILKEFLFILDKMNKINSERYD